MLETEFGGSVLGNVRLVRQKELLESVLEVSDILKQRRPDLNGSTLPLLAEVQSLLVKDGLSGGDLERIEKIVGYLCHFKCLYDFCPLEPLDGEPDQARWQRWGQILDTMRRRADLLREIKHQNQKKRSDRHG